MTGLEVLDPGPQALVEDLGRPGCTSIGVGRSGAADRRSLRLANRALGNDEGAAAVETLLGGLRLRVVGGPVWLCVTGAPCAVAVGERQVGSHVLARGHPGEEVRLGSPTAGLRSYLAVRGGLEPEPVLGSRSHDVMAGLGPPPLEPGQVLPVGAGRGDLPGTDVLPAPSLPVDGEPMLLHAVRGPRDDRIGDLEALVAITWTAADASNRIGIRLEGGPLAVREHAPPLPSEGAWRGAVQVPPAGQPVLFLPDHPVTGGYPVVAVVVDADVDRAAQVRPGQQIRFAWTLAP